MALQTHPDQAWPPLLQQLQEAQRLHLSAARQPQASGTEACVPARSRHELFDAPAEFCLSSVLFIFP